MHEDTKTHTTHKLLIYTDSHTTRTSMNVCLLTHHTHTWTYTRSRITQMRIYTQTGTDTDLVYTTHAHTVERTLIVTQTYSVPVSMSTGTPKVCNLQSQPFTRTHTRKSKHTQWASMAGGAWCCFQTHITARRSSSMLLLLWPRLPFLWSHIKRRWLPC